MTSISDPAGRSGTDEATLDSVIKNTSPCLPLIVREWGFDGASQRQLAPVAAWYRPAIVTEYRRVLLGDW